MPVYINPKQSLSIPKDDYLDTNENELYINDPDLVFDKLPQPFHFISKIVNRIFHDACVTIENNRKQKSAESKRSAVSIVSNFSMIKKLGNVRCISELGTDSDFVVVGLNNGVAVVDLISGDFVDHWENNDLDVVSIKCDMLEDRIYLLSAIDNTGSGNILAFSYNRLYLLKNFPGNKDSDKPCQVTGLFVDENCGHVAVSFDQFKENEQWVEIHKINRDAWIKELEAFGKAFEEYSVSKTTQSDEQVQNLNNRQSTDESSTFLDRTGPKVSGTTIVTKFKFTDVFKSTGVSSFSQLTKQIDTTGRTIGIGMNHCLSSDYFQKITSIFQNEYSDSKDIQIDSNSEANILRTPNLSYSKVAGSMIRDSLQVEGSDSALVFVWWSQSQHLLIYGLNKANQKTPSDGWTKPDAVRTFSCPITSSVLSFNNVFFCLGLQNGVLVLIDIVSGLTRLVEQISDSPLLSMYYLHFDDNSCDSFLKKGNLYLAVVDTDFRIYRVKYDLSHFRNDNEVVLISEDTNVDYFGRLSKTNDLALTILDRSLIIIRDMVSGEPLSHIQMPNNTSIISPWEPIFGFSSLSRNVCFAVSMIENLEDNNPEDQENNSETAEPLVVIYNLPLDYLSLKMYDSDFSKITKLFEIDSFINNTFSDSLYKRYYHHEERQRSIQESWNDLENILKSLS